MRRVGDVTEDSQEHFVEARRRSAMSARIDDLPPLIEKLQASGEQE